MNDNANRVFMVLILTVVFLIPDVYVGKRLWPQFESANYPSTTGRITHSEVIHWTTRGRRGGTVYKANIQYHYEVNGQAFDGARIRYSILSGRRNSTQISEEYPAGSDTQVYYNSKNPTDSLLSPGLDGWDIFCVLFLMPINMLGLAFWAALKDVFREWLFKPVAGTKIIADGNQLRVRLPLESPVLWAAFTACATSFVSIFMVVIAYFVSRSYAPAAVFLILSIASGIAVGVWRWRKIRSGFRDLIINQESGFIDLPKWHHRKQRMKVNTCDIDGIMVQAIEYQDSKGRACYNYAPTLQLRHGRMQTIYEWSEKEKANAFSKWLLEKIGHKALNLKDQQSS